MKKIIVVSFAVTALFFVSCGGQSGDSAKPTDSAATPAAKSPDSAANNAIVPPSAAPGNANNSSLADTTYKAKDTSKTKKH
jgi:hypothetical protein